MGKNPSIFVHIIQFRLKSSFFAHETDYPKGDRLNLRGKTWYNSRRAFGRGPLSGNYATAGTAEGGAMQTKKRIFLMDELRGFAVFCMVFYHGFYTMAYLLGLPWG